MTLPKDNEEDDKSVDADEEPTGTRIVPPQPARQAKASADAADDITACDVAFVLLLRFCINSMMCHLS
jgi:hypothetical protein